MTDQPEPRIEITALDHLLPAPEHVGHAENAAHRIEQRRKYEREQMESVTFGMQQAELHISPVTERGGNSVRIRLVFADETVVDIDTSIVEFSHTLLYHSRVPCVARILKIGDTP